jgi:hypothetical protein
MRTTNPTLAYFKKIRKSENVTKVGRPMKFVTGTKRLRKNFGDLLLKSSQPPSLASSDDDDQDRARIRQIVGSYIAPSNVGSAYNSRSQLNVMHKNSGASGLHHRSVIPGSSFQNMRSFYAQ